MLEPAIRDLASTGKNFGTIAVQLPNGQIASHVMWVDANDDQLLDQHRDPPGQVQGDPAAPRGHGHDLGRRRTRTATPRCAGTVIGEVRGDEARGAHRHAVAALPRPRLPAPIQSERVVLRIDPVRQRVERALSERRRRRSSACVMGSASDWSTMQAAVAVLERFGVAHEARVVSAHRMPDEMFAYAEAAARRGLRAIIAGAGGAAHLPGMLAAKTTVPVLGVPVPSRHLQGQDSLLSIVQMPAGIPVATFAIGEAGATNAALFAVAMLAADDAGAGRRARRRPRRAPPRPGAAVVDAAAADPA